MSDRSLDEFVPESGQQADGSDDEPEDSASAPSEEAVPEPATATASVSPDGVSCESCGETVRRRWHDDGTFVCRACKEWESV